MSGDPDQEFFSDSVTEEIISKLAKNPRITVIARNSTFTYKGEAVKVQQVAQELDVNHVLEGSVRKAGDRIRITAQLIDAATGAHLWTETYERKLQDIFAVQSDIALHIAAALGEEFLAAETELVRHVPTQDLSALGLCQKGEALYWDLDEESNAVAQQLFRKATELDPGFAFAHAMLGIALWTEYSVWNPDPQILKEAEQLGLKAASLDSGVVEPHALLAMVYSSKGQFAQAEAEGRRVLAIEPNNAEAYRLMGDIYNWTGRPEEAIESLTKAIRLNPRHRWNYLTSLATSYLNTGRDQDANDALAQALVLDPNRAAIHSQLANVYLDRWVIQQDEGPEILAQALEAAGKGVALDDDDLWGHLYLCLIHLWRKEYDQAVCEAERMIAIAPQAAEGYALLADIYTYVGRLEEAAELAGKAEQINPAVTWPFRRLYRLTCRLEDAAAVVRKSPVLDRSGSFWAHIDLAIINSELGRAEEAKAEAAEIPKLAPNFSVDVYGERIPYKDPAQAERDMAALRKAGLE